jgi:cytochrome P450/NADPH-cytochrome P450 reductase
MDVLTHHPSCALPFGDFLLSLPPMRVRQYSISSSPLKDPDSCTITFSILDRPSLSDPQVEFEGVASTYLSTLQAGDSVQVSIRPTSKKTFRIPADTKTPLLMFCAGTGLAPFRGFIEQRAIQLAANPGRKIAPALMFVGCRSQTKDRLFADEIDGWVKLGAVEVVYAFSREKEHSEGCAYVGERMLKEKDTVASMWYNGARAYVCGSREFAKGVGDAVRAILSEARELRDDEDGRKELQEWFQAMQERIASDVFD